MPEIHRFSVKQSAVATDNFAARQRGKTPPEASFLAIGNALNMAVYERRRALAADRELMITDTKFEFGLDSARRVTLAYEMLTPDSSKMQ